MEFLQQHQECFQICLLAQLLMAMAQLVIVQVELLKWLIWESKFDKEPTDLVLRERPLQLLEKDLLSQQLHQYPYHFMEDFFVMPKQICLFFKKILLQISLKFLQDCYQELCFLIFFLHLQYVQLVKLLLEWLSKLDVRLRKIQVFWKELLNQIMKLLFEYQQELHLFK